MIKKRKIIKNSKPDGVHYLIGLFGCSEQQTDNLKFWKETLIKGAQKNNIPILYNKFYKFKPQGVTGFLLLASSHLSIHTWPEYNYVACDVFSCSPKQDTDNLVQYVLKNVNNTRSCVKQIERGYKFFNFEKFINDEDELVVPIFSNDETVKVKIKKILGKVHSHFQDILFIDTPRFGKCLIIDGIMQTADSDHHIYDEAILSKLKSTDRNILILGGGDGYVAEKALKINPHLDINVVDLDIEVVHGCKKYLGQKVFDNERVHLYIEDAFNFLKDKKISGRKMRTYDGIVVDLTDEPIRGQELEDFRKFYSELLALCHDRLKKGGWLSIQAGASQVTSGHIDAVAVLSDVIQQRFKRQKIERKDVMIPSFGESNAFLFVKK